MNTLAVSRPTALWLRQHAATIVGFALLSVGLAGSPAMALAGAAALVFAGLRSFAAAQGYRLPRAGHLSIVPQGCWEVPLAFAVRRGRRAFLFHRAFDAQTGALPEEYTVHALPERAPLEALPFVNFQPPAASRRLGQVPAAELRFEHRGGAQVARAGLDLALARLHALKAVPSASV